MDLDTADRGGDLWPSPGKGLQQMAFHVHRKSSPKRIRSRDVVHLTCGLVILFRL
jgi:hypothetical protein